MRDGLEGSWWTSNEGSKYRNLLRNVTTARGRVSVTAKNKTSKGAVKERDLLLEAARKWHNTFGARWPRPRADVALDVWAITHTNPPQPQNYAKRLLDQLGEVDGKPVVYTDDRQVAMLFVRVDRTDGASMPDTVFFSAQLASSVRESVRYGAARRRERDLASDDWQSREFDWENRLEDAERLIETWRLAGTELAAEFFLPRALYKYQHLQQRRALSDVDHLAVGVLDSYAELRRSSPDRENRYLAEHLDLMASMPYAIDLGVLPSKSGDSEEFRARVDAAISHQMARYPSLFPLLCSVGVSIYYVPGQQGKDLDNVLRLLMPPLLKDVHPPRTPYDDPDALDEERFRLWDDVRQGKAMPPQAAVSFVEAVALKDVPYAPGTVIATLSDGRRRQSWWKLSSLDER